MSLIIKIFLIEDWSKEPSQIRRFAWDTGLKYDELCEKVLNLYPTLIGTDLTLKWKDEEGDFVDVSSDTELLDAAKACEGHLLKLWVSTEKKPCEPRNPWAEWHRGMWAGCRRGRGGRLGKACEKESRMTHWGYSCDGCEGSIVGKRYHCRSCPDYDLCQDCFDANKHPEHSLVEIRFPKRGRRSCSRDVEKEFLQQVGEDVATLLEPLDINVDVEVQDRPETEKPVEAPPAKPEEAPRPATAPEPAQPRQPVHPNSYLAHPPPQAPHFMPYPIPAFPHHFPHMPDMSFDPMHHFEAPAPAYNEPTVLIPVDMSPDQRKAMETLREMGFDITNAKLVQNVRKNGSDVPATINEMLKN